MAEDVDVGVAVMKLEGIPVGEPVAVTIASVAAGFIVVVGSCNEAHKVS